MPAGPGETHLTTLFADVHYYFSNPAATPLHHRFDRGSYLYLFHNAQEHRSKLEIANHAGTPQQDAISGYLDSVVMSYSFKQPTLCTLTIESSHPTQANQWYLSTFDMTNTQQEIRRVNTLDIYLWTEKDAASLLGHLKAIIPPDHLKIRDAPSISAEHRDSRSPVVQQLENTAISSSFAPRAASTISSSSVPGPPTPATSGGGPTSPPTSPPQHMPYNPATPAAPEPIAYREKTPPPPDDGSGTGLANAARYDVVPQQPYSNVPSAFGPNANQRQPYFTGPPGQQQDHTPPLSFPGPPGGALAAGNHQTNAGSLPSPPTHANPRPFSYQLPLESPGPRYQQLPPSFAPHSQSAAPQQHTSPPPPSFAGPPQNTPYNNYPQQQMSFGPTAVASPGLPQAMAGQYQPTQPQTPSAPPAYSSQHSSAPQYNNQAQQQPSQSQPQVQQQQPQPHPAQREIFAYSNYSYTNPATAAAHPNAYGSGGAYTGDVHSQVYRPTEAEAKHGHHGGHAARPPGPGRTGTGDSGSGRMRLEAKAQQVEKRVGGFLKKLDKMI